LGDSLDESEALQAIVQRQLYSGIVTARRDVSDPTRWQES